MTYSKIYFSCLLFIIPFSVYAKDTLWLTSPNGDLSFKFELTRKSPVYQVFFKGKKLIDDSEVGLVFNEQQRTFKSNLTLGTPKFQTVDETYDLIVGKVKSARNHHNEVTIPLTEKADTKRKINLVVRAFDDGLAFRYELQSKEDWASYELVDEYSTFNIHGNPLMRAMLWDNFTNSHEGFFSRLNYEETKADTLIDSPVLFEFPQNIYLAITEANLRDYAGMYLKKIDGALKSELSPLPGQSMIKVRAKLPHRTPWRVMMISDDIGRLLESTILTSLSDPPAFEDTSWIKPGKTTFHWWNGDITPDTSFAPGNNFETNKYYIDFAARNNIDYHAVIGYGGVPWYQSDAADYSVIGEQLNVTKSVSTLDMQKICEYAKEKGVGIHVWVHWRAIYPNLEKAFAQFRKWGIDGMMVDFMNRDDQEMINIQEEILKKVAEYKLYIQFHGSSKPTGLSRTFPNEFTREAAYNYEYNKFREAPVDPNHDLDVAFIRSLAGPTDYHLGGFRAVPKSEFKTQYTRPLMIGTRAHMLAMYVALESYLGSLCDYPEAYESQPGFDFIKDVPTTWDETVVPNAVIDEFLVVARRNGTDWYIGSLNNDSPRTITVPLEFLPSGDYEAVIYADAEDVADNPNKLTIINQSVTQKDTITLKLAAGGGSAIKLSKI